MWSGRNSQQRQKHQHGLSHQADHEVPEKEKVVIGKIKKKINKIISNNHHALQTDGKSAITAATTTWHPLGQDEEGLVLLTIAPGVPFSPGAPASP